MAIGNRNADQIIVFIQVDRDDAALHRTGEIGQAGLLHRTVGRGKKHVFVLDKLGDRQNRIDLLTVFQRQQINDRLAARSRTSLRHIVYLHPVHAPLIGEAQDEIMGIGDEQVVDEVIILVLGCLTAAATALLRTIFVHLLRLHVAAMRQGHHHILGRNQVFHAHVMRVRDDLAAALVAELHFHCRQLIADDDCYTFRFRQYIEQIRNLVHHFAVFADDLVLLHAGQTLQTQFQNRLSLRIGQIVAAHAVFFEQTELGRQTIRARRIADAAQHILNQG